MISGLFTQWSAYDDALMQVLPLAEHEICLFDGDLSKLDLEKRERADYLRRFLAASPRNRLRPRLFTLLADFPHAVEVWEASPPISSLTDSLLLIDDRHALIRIHEDHARSRLIRDDAAACRPYRLRFDEILREGGIPISATTLGL